MLRERPQAGHKETKQVHKITFFPLCKEGARPANAETFRIDLANGRTVLGDYADTRDYTNDYDLRWKLKESLKADLKKASKNYFDVVMFTHLDDDHVRGAGEFFWFERFSDRQQDDRVRMQELWVPAAAIVETGLEGDAELIRAEARYRLKQKNGIRVFSAPNTLAEWCTKEGLDLEELKDRGLVVDAGKLVPGFSLYSDAVEFFVHSPFASRTDDGHLLERNKDAIVMQAKFEVDNEHRYFLITADVCHEELDEIVRMTKLRENEERLIWDVIDLPHHCSYTGIGPEKGATKTAPTDGVKWLHEQGNTGALLISSSCIIPNEDTEQPPHRQAAAYYKDVTQKIGDGEFVVTMEHPTKAAPKPIVIEITGRGVALKREALAVVGGGAVAAAAPRVG
jgi:hypothetical protein